MHRPTNLLFKLLLTLFRSNDDVREFISSLDYPQIEMLLAGLDGTQSPRIAFTLGAAEQLKAHSQDEKALFDLLEQRFPARKELIETTSRAYLGNSGPQASAVEERPVTDLGPVPDAAVATHEKLMGDRATFLDVAYLERGAEMARAVVKLRMNFAGKWYTGTAFLIGPGRLLTAHHNLCDETGKKAAEVTAQFDYLRAPDSGLEAEGLTVTCRIDTIRGEPNDDWAVIDLDAPQGARPVIRFADTPAQKGDRVAIIQHPGGMAKQVALHNNLVTFADTSRVQYLTDTLPGSSGAPVFDTRWNVVALHHAGGDLQLPGTKQIVYRNQGIAIALVRQRLAAAEVPGKTV